MLLQHVLYDGKTDTASHFGALVRLVPLADLVISVPDVRQILRRDSVAVVGHFKPYQPAFLTEQPHDDRVVVPGVGHGVVYQVVDHLLKLCYIRVDNDIILRFQLDYYAVVLFQNVKS